MAATLIVYNELRAKDEIYYIETFVCVHSISIARWLITFVPDF